MEQKTPIVFELRPWECTNRLPRHDVPIGFIFVRFAAPLEFLWSQRAHNAADIMDRRRYLRGCTMAFDYILSGGVTVLITVYLAYALWRPERF